MKFDFVIPVYNEERDLGLNARKLHDFLSKNMLDDWGIVIADNASTDSTCGVAERLCAELSRVSSIHLGRKGRGGALRASWLASSADVVGYMDVDLSTDISVIPAVVAAFKGGADIVVGNRFSREARVVRGLKRTLLSRGYNLLVRLVLGLDYADAQCGFKFIRSSASRKLVPQVRDNNWFFDTELLYLAQRSGLRVVELPVGWVEDKDTRVVLHRIVPEYLGSVIKLRLRTLKP